jgi:hypothetical protein
VFDFVFDLVFVVGLVLVPVPDSPLPPLLRLVTVEGPLKAGEEVVAGPALRCYLVSLITLTTHTSLLDCSCRLTQKEIQKMRTGTFEDAEHYIARSVLGVSRVQPV